MNHKSSIFNSNSMRMVKLDRRHSGHGYFSHYVEPWGTTASVRQSIHDWRIWLWNNFGPGCERDLAMKEPFCNQIKWGWETHYHCRIYLTPEVYTLVSLKCV
jgi:hypothetical protein